MSLHYTGYSRSEGRIARLECDTCGNGAVCTDISPAWGLHECQECFNEVCSRCQPILDCGCKKIVCPNCVRGYQDLKLCASCYEEMLFEEIERKQQAVETLAMQEMA